MLATTDNYGAVPRSYDRQKIYLFPKEWTDAAFEYKKKAPEMRMA
jgi:hypothetical protein